MRTRVFVRASERAPRPLRAAPSLARVQVRSPQPNTQHKPGFSVGECNGTLKRMLDWKLILRQSVCESVGQSALMEC